MAITWVSICCHHSTSESHTSDVQLPMWVVGPGVPPGRVLWQPTQHVDFAATFVDLAGAQEHAPSDLDGMSFVPLLSPEADDSTPWRPLSYSEFHENCNTWRAIRVANATHTMSFRMWCTNETELFDLIQDPYELNNLARPGAYRPGDLSKYKRYIQHMSTCKGDTCWNPKVAQDQPTFPECYLGLCTHAPNYGLCGHYTTKLPQLCNGSAAAELELRQPLFWI